MSVNSEPILAVAEAPKSYDVSAIYRIKWQTMTFNAFELGSTDAVKNACDNFKLPHFNKRGLRQYKQRVSEIENLYAKLYEDMKRELITEKRFQMLSGRYDM